jgi:hypothetical protein
MTRQLYRCRDLVTRRFSSPCNAITFNARRCASVATLASRSTLGAILLFTMSDIARPQEALRLRDGRGKRSLRTSQLSRPGGARRDRTDDLLLAKQALSQLSYGPGPSAGTAPEFRYEWMVGLGRLELPTSRLSSARSNQLSYKPMCLVSPRESRSYGPATITSMC